MLWDRYQYLSQALDTDAKIIYNSNLQISASFYKFYPSPGKTHQFMATSIYGLNFYNGLTLGLHRLDQVLH